MEPVKSHGDYKNLAQFVLWNVRVLGFARGIMDKSHQETAGIGKIKERCLIYRHL